MSFPKSNQKSPVIVDTMLSHDLETISTETLAFYTTAGAVDAGEAAGTIVYGKLDKAPVMSLLGDRLAEYTGNTLSTSLVFTTGVLDSTKEIAFNYDGEGANRFTKMAETLTALVGNGWWACDYLTGLIIVKKAAATATQAITSYKVKKLTTAGSSSSSGGASSAGSSGAGVFSNVLGDFTATANAGAKTITLSAYASTLLSATITTKNFANAVIKRITSAGVVDTLPLTSIALAANILTLADMTANFAAGDTVAVFVPGNDKAYDETNDWVKNADQQAPNYELQTEGLAATHPAGMATSTRAITRFASTALEASRIIKASAGRLYELMGRVDKTAPTADYWVLIMNSATLPADGAVTLLDRFKIVHTNGVDNVFDFTDNFGAYGSSGLVVCLSTTEFTKTISGAYLSITGKYA